MSLAFAQHQTARGTFVRDGVRVPGRCSTSSSLHFTNVRYARHIRSQRSGKLHCFATFVTDAPVRTEGEVDASGLPVYTGESATKSGKLRVVVLGSGWGAVSLVKSLSIADSEKIDLTLISPRNFFLYTPLLPAVATGTVEERSIVEPIRRVVNRKGKYFEAVAQSIDPVSKTLVACFPKDAGMDEACFKVPYDILVLAVGSVNNTFGIQGVEDYCFFFKSVDDANRLRSHVSELFERAALPGCFPEVRKQLLSFVVCGGGPTGVEVAAELHDMIQEDLSKLYPELIEDAKVRIIELQDHLLSTYDRQISIYTNQQFARAGIELVLNSKVQSVRKNVVCVSNADGSMREIPFGACVWATGVAMHPLVKQLKEVLPPGTQTNFRSIATNEYLQVKGSNGTIYALGDAATIEQDKALDRVPELFDRADTNKNGVLELQELQDLLREASKEYSHFEEHSRFLDAKYGTRRWGGMVRNILIGMGKGSNALADIKEDTKLTKEEFGELIAKIDKGLRSLPATAQVAKQEGEYMARLLAAGIQPGQPLPEGAAPFEYKHKGSLAYIGNDKAVMAIPGLKAPILGYGAGILWKGFETYSQVSLRNIFLVGLDWVRTKLFGRDISRV
eukprot:jgi/Botrbrau1/17001/Bobra.49_2s0060.1